MKKFLDVASKYFNIVLIVVLFLTSFKTLYNMYFGYPITIDPWLYVVVSTGWAIELMGNEVRFKKEKDSKTNKEGV